MNKKHQYLCMLADILKVSKPDIFSQDWEYEISIESHRIDELIEIYKNEKLNNYQKEILIKIILEILNDNINNKEWIFSNKLEFIINKIKFILHNDYFIHKETIYKYADLENNIEDCFPISKIFRSLIKEIKDF